MFSDVNPPSRVGKSYCYTVSKRGGKVFHRTEFVASDNFLSTRVRPLMFDEAWIPAPTRAQNARKSAFKKRGRAAQCRPSGQDSVARTVTARPWTVTEDTWLRKKCCTSEAYKKISRLYSGPLCYNTALREVHDKSIVREWLPFRQAALSSGIRDSQRWFHTCSVSLDQL